MLFQNPLEALKKQGALKGLADTIRDGKSASVFGMPFYNRVYVASLFSGCVYVHADLAGAAAAHSQLLSMGVRSVLLPPAPDCLVYTRKKSGEQAFERFKAMYAIARGQADVTVTTFDALYGLFPLRETFTAAGLTLHTGRDYELEGLCADLARAGYARAEQVTAAGEYARRGDIVDVFLYGEQKGLRFEFFGDTLEKIKTFDFADQRADGERECAEIFPATDVFYNAEQAQSIIKTIARAAKRGERTQSIADELALRLAAGENDQSLSFILPVISHTDFFGFVAPECVVYDDCKAIADCAINFKSELSNRFSLLLEKGETFNFCHYGVTAGEADCVKLGFHRISSQNRIFTPQAVFNFDELAMPDFSRDGDSFAAEVKARLADGYDVFIACGGLSDNIRELFSRAGISYTDGDLSADGSADFAKADKGEAKSAKGDYDGSAGGKAQGKGTAVFLNAAYEKGVIFACDKLMVAGEQDLKPKSARPKRGRTVREVFVQPEVGDYVVHSVHGIGRLSGIQRLTLTDSARDYFVVEYAGGDTLKVPIENMTALSKYVSGDIPALSKIGGADFARVKEKVRAGVKKLAFDLTQLYALRGEARGHAYSPDDTFLKEFCDDFPFTETEDQLRAAAEAIGDLTAGKVMDRLLCGDVGYGKTEVALRVAFKVICEGKQVAFVSPTTILARQHYINIKERMEKFGVRVGTLTRFNTRAEQSATLSKLALKQLDIVVGTHRLLSKDVVFSDLGLLVVDEEQRFGVGDKEKIKSVKNSVNVLSLSATPIPRTLHMSLVGIRDISVLDTPPADRIPVQTFVAEYTEALAADAIMREVNRGGQVFVVYNRVESIDKFAAKLADAVNVRVGVAHGQMAEKMLEAEVEAFYNGETDVLVASTIIENGIDLPRANTMIVVDSDRLGLSQLYQLRGRVGRGSRLAYVYFTYDGERVLSETAVKRLEAISQYTEFGSGFKLAMKDLEIRGAGNILGAEQHGHMEKVGYDLYCKFLAEAVAELSGQGGGTMLREKKEAKVLCDFDAFVPEAYVRGSQWRIKLYGDISALKTAKARDELIESTADIYGKPPQSVLNLMNVALVKNLAEGLGAVVVSLKKEESYLTFERIAELSDAAVKRAAKYGAALHSLKGKLSFGGGSKGRAALTDFLINLSQK